MAFNGATGWPWPDFLGKPPEFLGKGGFLGKAGSMIRLVGALLLVAMLSGSAAAECAWVLWDFDHQPVDGGVTKDKIWIVVSGHQSLPDCEARRAKLAKDVASTISRFHEAIGIKDSKPYFSGLGCLPDTIDPRGPKSR